MVPRRFQDAPGCGKMAQDASKMPPSGPKMPPSGPKMPPRGSQEAPRRPTWLGKFRKNDEKIDAEISFLLGFIF